MLRDAKTNSIAKRMRRPPLGGDTYLFVIKGSSGNDIPGCDGTVFIVQKDLIPGSYSQFCTQTINGLTGNKLQTTTKSYAQQNTKRAAFEYGKIQW